MPARALLAKIHIAKKELGLTDEVYRDILNAKCKVQSAKLLNDEQANKLVRHFKELGWFPYAKTSGDKKPKAKKYDDIGKRDPYKATPKQLRKIEVLWHEVYRGNYETKHLRQFLFNEVKVSDILFLDHDQAYKVIEALKAMHKRKTEQ